MDDQPHNLFFFQLSFSNTLGKEEVVFKEISGITMEMGFDGTSEGSDNNFRRLIPTSLKYSNLVLKRGSASKDSELFIWCMKTFNANQEDSIKVKNIIIRLWDTGGILLKSWLFSDAYPVKWVVSDLNSNNNNVAIESLEFAYSSFQ